MLIKIINYKQDCKIGVYDFEQVKETKLLFNLEIKYDASEAIANDDIQDAIDYDEVVNLIKEVTKERFKLLETLATKILNELKIKFETISNAKIEIAKIGIIENVEQVSITQEI